ncbi:aspartate 1-decarboxylase [Pseudothermotoga thermarum]|uniref:Aspartate 1-decarboxylase n=1 Tax=Pseudothermotoga thermarum DSM 5069 TaxID=688269 RepID=F7YXB3_9THEM|nr:aspartate 1-decarboxylase [Pseudothermotoga thermarum]AEH51491.1 L-aspartate 1-decarboxylase [Pseudothermotoga thermarum DSM 5069]
MKRLMLKSKLHMARVTDKNLEYEGSIEIDENLMKAVDLKEFEQVLVVDIENANRFETYVIKGKAGSGIIALNGAAARLVEKGDRIIIMAFGLFDDDEYKSPKIAILNERNEIVQMK